MELKVDKFWVAAHCLGFLLHLRGKCISERGGLMCCEEVAQGHVDTGDGHVVVIERQQYIFAMW